MFFIFTTMQLIFHVRK